MTSNEQNLTSKNAAYATTFKEGDLTPFPTGKLAIVTCMDGRIDPCAAFGIPLGAALVIRNAGGSAREALRSLTLSQQFLGTDEVHVIKHTDCGMQSLKDDVAREVLEKNLGPEAGKECQHMDFLTFEDLDGEVKRDVEFLKASSLIRAQGGISGWVYDVNEGKVRKVV